MIRLLQCVNHEGTWVRIDDDSVAKYCFDKSRGIEAWSLAINKQTSVIYMKLEQELENDPIEKKPMIPDSAVSPSNKGFDFSVPSVSHEGFNFTTQNYTPEVESIDSCNTNPFVFGSYNQHDSPGIYHRKNKSK